jgi:hypothetical protein
VEKPLGSEDKRRRRLIWRLVLAPIAAIVVVAGVGAAIWFATGRAELNKALAELRSAGIPTDMEEMIPPGVSGVDNAAVAYKSAWKQLQESPSGLWDKVRALPDVPTGEWTPRVRAILGDYVEGNQAAVELTEKAARFEKCRFPLDYSLGINMELPHLPHIIALARLMYLHAVDCLTRGNFEGAVDACFTVRAIGRHCASDPTLISKAVDFACFAISSEGLELTLAYGHPSEDQLVRLLQRINDDPPDTDLTRAFGAESCLWRTTYRDLCAGRATIPGESGGAKKAPIWLRLGFRVAADRDLAVCVRVMKTYADLARQPYFEAKPLLDAKSPQLENLSSLAYPLAKVGLGHIMAPIYTEALADASNVKARHRLHKLVVALMIYEKRHARFPEGLDALSPDIIAKVPVDPFSGKPYVYRREGGGLVVYSLDRDMKDDGGASRQAGSEKGDIVFRYARTN